ncbi:MAG: hypothetical protein AABY07_02615 [Nanoarchaeota archaeon]
MILVKRGGIIILFVTLSLLIAPFAFAVGDVAYIYKKSFKIDNNIINSFNRLGLSVDTINENQVRSTDFSQYRFIFVGDEKFTNPSQIPVKNYPSIVINNFHGDDWGLTDNDGISSLARTQPLNVIKGSSIIQVYTRAFFRDGSTFAIPYYYLDKNNKAPSLETIAEAHNGNGGLGDVISYAENGDILRNGGFVNGKICFYGIVESDFWTSSAENMFNECTIFTGSACIVDEECGNGDESDPYCVVNNIFKDVTSVSCENPGNLDSACVGETTSVLIESCDDACSNGECIEFECETNSECNDNNSNTEDICNEPNTIDSFCTHAEIECFTNSECGEDQTELFCDENNLNQNITTFLCVNAGTVESECQNNTITQLVQICTNGCENTQCVSINHDIALEKDLANSIDGIRIEKTDGTDILSEALQCSEKYKIVVSVVNLGDFFENVTFEGSVGDVTINHNAIENFAPGDDSLKTKTINFTLDQGFYNITIEAIIPIDLNLSNNIAKRQVEIQCEEITECSQDSDCGSQTNQIICLNDDVYNRITTPICSSNECDENVDEVLIQNCNNGCLDGECVPGVFECLNNNDCNDNNLRTVDECVNPETSASFCRNTEVNCLTNSDCGFIGFIGNEFCSSNNVFENYQNAVCVDSGSLESNCIVTITSQLIQDCNDNNVLTIDSCVQNEQEETALCIHDLGEECTLNSDCGNIENENICISNDVYRRTTTPICSSNECDENINDVLIQNCNNGCLDGECIEEPVECTTNSQCNDGNPYTLDICENNNCRHEEIECITNLDCGTDGFIGGPYCSEGEYQGLPLGFEPILSYSQGINENAETISFWDANGNAYVLRQGTNNFEIINNEQEGNLCLDEFIPIVGYTHHQRPDNKEVVELWDAKGDVRILVEGESKFRSLTEQEKIDLNINGFVPSLGYSHRIGGLGQEIVSLINNDKIKLKKKGESRFRDLTPQEIQNNGLNNFDAIEGYYHNGTNKVYLMDANGVMKRWNNSLSKFETVVPNGLPPGTPDAAYHSQLNNKGIFIYENDIYTESFNDLTFNKVQFNNLVLDFKSYTCNNPETVQSFCSSSTEPITQQICSQECLNGACTQSTPKIEKTNIIENECNVLECTQNSDCGNIENENICINNHVYNRITTPTCSSNECTSSTQDNLVRLCQFGCLDGECIPDTRECIRNTDCNDDNRLTQDICNEDNECENIPLECTLNSDCGDVLRELICQGNNVVNRVTIPTCSNNECSQNFNEIFVESCNFGCSNGECLPEPQTTNINFPEGSRENYDSTCSVVTESNRYASSEPQIIEGLVSGETYTFICSAEGSDELTSYTIRLNENFKKIAEVEQLHRFSLVGIPGTSYTPYDIRNPGDYDNYVQFILEADDIYTWESALINGELHARVKRTINGIERHRVPITAIQPPFQMENSEFERANSCPVYRVPWSTPPIAGYYDPGLVFGEGVFSMYEWKGINCNVVHI